MALLTLQKTPRGGGDKTGIVYTRCKLEIRIRYRAE